MDRSGVGVITAVIMAGGKGTRMESVTGGEIPKPMVKLAGKPILEHQINRLVENGIKQIILITGYLHEIIEAYFGDGSFWGIQIEYIVENEPLGTGGALFYLRDKMEGDFFLLFGDLLFDLDLSRFLDIHQKEGAAISVVVHPNSHPEDSDLLILNQKNWVTGFLSKKEKRGMDYNNQVNAGFYLLNARVLKRLQQGGKRDFEKDILISWMKEESGVYGYRTPEYIKDVGTTYRLWQADKDRTMGMVRSRNLKYSQKCIFLDRDGTLNQYRGLIRQKEDIQLEETVSDAIRKINRSEYLAIVITNQPVVARNLCSLEEVEQMHRRLETLLGKEGAYVDGIAYCPHHPDGGYPEENPIYKIVCNCRKPEIGMIKEWQEKYEILLEQSWMVGDTTRDIQTGIHAGMRTILVKTGEGGKDHTYSVQADLECETLLEAVELILDSKEKEG